MRVTNLREFVKMRPFAKLMQFLFMGFSIVMYGAMKGTNLCDWRSTRIIHINLSHINLSLFGSRARFTAPIPSQLHSAGQLYIVKASFSVYNTAT